MLTPAGRAQGNLQFNQVKLITGLETVPDGKVWKVEAFLPTEVWRVVSSTVNPRIYICGINGTDRQVGHSGGTNNSTSSVGGMPVSFIELPLWLPEGSTLNPTVSNSFLWGVSVIEFNVIPE